VNNDILILEGVEGSFLKFLTRLHATGMTLRKQIKLADGPKSNFRVSDGKCRDNSIFNATIRQLAVSESPILHVWAPIGMGNQGKGALAPSWRLETDRQPPWTAARTRRVEKTVNDIRCQSIDSTVSGLPLGVQMLQIFQLQEGFAPDHQGLRSWTPLRAPPLEPAIGLGSSSALDMSTRPRPSSENSYGRPRLYVLTLISITYMRTPL